MVSARLKMFTIKSGNYIICDDYDVDVDET